MNKSGQLAFERASSGAAEIYCKLIALLARCPRVAARIQRIFYLPVEIRNTRPSWL